MSIRSRTDYHDAHGRSQTITDLECNGPTCEATLTVDTAASGTGWGMADWILLEGPRGGPFEGHHDFHEWPCLQAWVEANLSPPCSSHSPTPARPEPRGSLFTEQA